MVTVCDDAPDGNKELKKKVTSDVQQLYFRAAGEPWSEFKSHEIKIRLPFIHVTAGFSPEANILTLAAYEQAQRALRGECELDFAQERKRQVFILATSKKRTDNTCGYPFFFGRSGGTRTRGLQYPKLARYQLRYTSN